MPTDFEEESRSPLYLTLEEHYCYDLKDVVPIDDVKNGVKNAWLPEGLHASGSKVRFTSGCSATITSLGLY